MILKGYFWIKRKSSNAQMIFTKNPKLYKSVNWVIKCLDTSRYQQYFINNVNLNLFKNVLNLGMGFYILCTFLHHGLAKGILKCISLFLIWNNNLKHLYKAEGDRKHYHIHLLIWRCLNLCFTNVKHKNMNVNVHI